MTEQDGTQPSTKQRSSRKISTANQHSDKQAPAVQRPADDSKDGWKVYWKAQGQPWRTEPEIATERQKYLAERRTITPNIEQGIYPFKAIKLSRADVEWLLAMHDGGRGPIDWKDASQREREGLDLRGAVVEDATDLTYLPLARLRGGLFPGEWEPLTEEQRAPASLCLKGAQLSYAHLEGACLCAAHLERAHLVEAHLEEADLGYTHLAGADLLWGYLAEADLEGAHLEETRLSGARLASVDLTGTTLANATGVGPSLADIKWGDINLAVVDWGHVKRLGDEYVATQKRYLQAEWVDRTGRAIPHQVGDLKDKDTQLEDYKAAVRANRQLAVVLRDQGLNEEADHFAYRAQLLQRMVFWREHEFGHWLFSLLLALLSGYGYRIWRILAAYVVVVSLFALVYFIFGRYYPPHLPLHQAFLESITAFHGRVFLEQFNPDTPQIWFTALEAIAGLIIEGVFIAMLIQRFFGK